MTILEEIKKKKEMFDKELAQVSEQIKALEIRKRELERGWQEEVLQAKRELDTLRTFPNGEIFVVKEKKSRMGKRDLGEKLGVVNKNAVYSKVVKEFLSGLYDGDKVTSEDMANLIRRLHNITTSSSAQVSSYLTYLQDKGSITHIGMSGKKKVYRVNKTKVSLPDTNNIQREAFIEQITQEREMMKDVGGG